MGEPAAIARDVALDDERHREAVWDPDPDIVGAHAIEKQTRPITYFEYERTPEAHHEELHYGWIVREYPDPLWHASQALHLGALLSAHVRSRNLGLVIPEAGSVLDMEEALCLAPDIGVVLNNRLDNIRPRAEGLSNKIWGTPNIVIEIASPSTWRRDREQKVHWYRTYGAEECWLVDARRRTIEVFDFSLEPTKMTRLFAGDAMFVSRVLPDFRYPTSALFDPLPDDLAQRAARSSYDKGSS